MSAQTATKPPPTTRDLLEAWRLSLGVTHEAFAARIGRDAGSWSRIRHGLQSITATSMRDVLRVAEDPWRMALAMAWLREALHLEDPLTARPSVGEPTAEADATLKKV